MELTRPPLTVEARLIEDAGRPTSSGSPPVGSDAVSASSGPYRPRRRTYASPAGGSRDVDAFDRVVRLRVLGWSLVGALLGLFLGVFLMAQGRPGWIIAVTALVGWAVAYIGPLLILRGAGRVGSALYAPSGRTTPRKREHSLAESFVARGEHQAAVDAFEEAVLEDPRDPRPYLRIARIQRDELGDPEGAARWFKRALAESEMTAGVRLLTQKELIELYVVRMGRPRSAAPVLARIAEEAAGTSDARWAAAELARIKAEMVADPDTP